MFLILSLLPAPRMSFEISMVAFNKMSLTLEVPPLPIMAVSVWKNLLRFSAKAYGQ